LNADDAQGLVLDAVEAHFGSHDFTIQPVLALVIARTAVKEVSDVNVLLAMGTSHPHRCNEVTHPGKPGGPRHP
jgi:hypothetical protein